MTRLTTFEAMKKADNLALEVAARDWAINQLAERLDLDYDMVGEFCVLVSGFKERYEDEKRAKALADALTS